MARPVTNRSASAGPRPSTARASVVLATTPATMLPSMSRRRDPHGPRCVRQLDGHAELTDLPELRMLDVHDHLAVVHLRIADHLLRVVDLAHADVGLDEELVPLVAGARLDDRLDLAAGAVLFRVGRADELIGLARELEEIGPVDGLAEVLPQPRLGTGDGEELVVAGLVDRVVPVGAGQEALAALRSHAVGEEETHVGRRRQ